MDKWTRLYNWLNDTRFAITPDENMKGDMKGAPRALIDGALIIVDATLEEMESLENEEGETPNE